MERALKVGDKLMAAFEDTNIEYIRGGKLCVPRFRRALKVWRRLAPSGSRLPCLESHALCISGDLLYRAQEAEGALGMGGRADQLREMALANLEAFSLYLRPSEMLGMCTLEVVSPAGANSQAASDARCGAQPSLRSVLRREGSSMTKLSSDRVVRRPH